MNLKSVNFPTLIFAIFFIFYVSGLKDKKNSNIIIKNVWNKDNLPN